MEIILLSRLICDSLIEVFCIGFDNFVHLNRWFSAWCSIRNVSSEFCRTNSLSATGSTRRIRGSSTGGAICDYCRRMPSLQSKLIQTCVIRETTGGQGDDPLQISGWGIKCLISPQYFHGAKDDF
jgi:hypothetical protein